MPIYTVKEKYRIFRSTKGPEAPYREELSKLIKNEFGIGPYPDQKEIRKVIIFSLEYFISEFKKVIHKELSLDFYRNILWLNEQTVELAHFHTYENIHPQIPESYIPLYRRVLKMILEEAIEIDMKCYQKDEDPIYLMPRIEEKLDKLIFLGDMIIMCVELYAEQDMVEDCIDIIFDENGLYEFTRKHHYDHIIEHLQKELGSHITREVVDKSMFADFKKALKKCFGIDYDHTGHVLVALQNELRKVHGWCPPMKWDLLPKNLSHIFGYDEDTSEQFYEGLTLCRKNKMSLFDLVSKPYKLTRYLYRPILIWTIEGKEYAFVGINAWTESLNQIDMNAIPWGKAPEEWMRNKCFKAYVHSKEDEHDKWLDDAVEDVVKRLEVFYDRNVKFLSKKDKAHERIDVKGLGEIDFIVVVPYLKKIFIVDCKNLLGRYDMVNQKNDFNAFTKSSKNKKSYNENLKGKIEWFEQNFELLQEHFQTTYKNNTLNFSDYSLEGIFIVNSSTFYMYNSYYRIYTLSQIESVLKGEYIDPRFTIIIEKEEETTFLSIKYPYFQKPRYIKLDQFTEEE